MGTPSSRADCGEGKVCTRLHYASFSRLDCSCAGVIDWLMRHAEVLWMSVSFLLIWYGIHERQRYPIQTGNGTHECP